jgi:hypothetical protein
MPGSASTYKRECNALGTQAGGTRHSRGDFSCGLVLASPERAHWSTQLLHRSPDFQRFVDYRVTYTSLDRRGMPRSAWMRRVRTDVEAALSPDNSREISEGSTFSNLREVIMTMREYEERFRPPAPSLHQTFAEIRGPKRGGRRSRRLWVTATLVGVMTITSKAALHHSTHANGSQVSKSGIQACDFIHR